VTKIGGIIFNEIEINRHLAASLVSFGSDSELKGPSAITDTLGIINAEVNNIDLADRGRGNKADSGGLLILDST